MLIARWIVRCVLVAAATLALTGCPGILRPSELPPSVDRAEDLARQGNQAEAARIYEALAAQNSGADRNEFLFRAAQAYLAVHSPDDAERVLALVEPPLAGTQGFELSLLNAQLALARGQGQQAWQRLSSIPEPRTVPEAIRYYQLKEQVAFAAGRPVDAILAEVARERFLPGPQEIRQSRAELLSALRDASEHGMKLDPRATTNPVVRGWLEVASLAAASARNPSGAADLEAWRTRNPNHPASSVGGAQQFGQQSIQPVQPAQPVTGEAHVALLLPITGRQGAAAISVREGFMTAYYQAPAGQRPRVRIYDTGEASVAETVARATQEGADFIVGPLTRDEVTAAAELTTQHPPVLALNFLPTERPAPASFYQFALSPEDEARQVARRVLEEGHHHGVALVPTGDWGTRVLTAFKQELEAGGGGLYSTATFDTVQTDYAEPITQVLRIADSRARYKRLESILGTKLQFEPRRRGDIEFIFAPAQANIERLLRPQLRFHYAGDIPTYATSDAFDPDPRANQDLEGLIFPDMPWMLGSDLADAVRTATKDAWPTGGPRRGRLFAFGFDSYRLAVALRGSGPSPNPTVEGLTGRLTLDSDRRVHRDLNWAQLHNGELQVLQAAAQ